MLILLYRLVPTKTTKKEGEMSNGMILFIFLGAVTCYSVNFSITLYAFIGLVIGTVILYLILKIASITFGIRKKAKTG